MSPAETYIIAENQRLTRENAELRSQLAHATADKDAFEFAVVSVTRANRAIAALAEEQNNTIIELSKKLKRTFP